MVTKREALKLALEALEKHAELGLLAGATITAIREALREHAMYEVQRLGQEIQPEQEPVAWMYQDKSTHEVRFQKHMKDFVDHSKTSEVPLYSEPLANHELQCVCGAVWCGDEMVHLPNKTPPQRKPLSNQKIIEMYNEPRSDAEMIEFARAIEAAHGIWPENSDCYGSDWTDRDGEYLK